MLSRTVRLITDCQAPLSTGQMASRLNRVLHSATAPLVAVLAGAFLVAGCDTAANQSDKKVQSDIQKAAVAKDRIDGTAEARKILETAVQDSSPQPLTRAYAKSSLAQLEQDVASDAMRRVETDEVKLTQLVYEIGQLAQQVDETHTVAAAYEKYDPKPARDAIAQKIADAQGGPDKPDWLKQDGMSIPSLAAVQQTISRLEGEIAKKHDELKSLTDQRTQLLDEAEQAAKSSDVSKGQQSVDEYKRAADLRQQAGDLSVQIEKNNADTVPLEKDRSVAQGQQVVLQDVIKQLQDESQQLDTGWKAVQDAVAAQAVLSKSIVEGDGAPGAAAVPPAAPAADATGAAAPTAQGILSPTVAGSLNAKVTAMAAMVEAIKQDRSEAESNLNSSIQHFKAAANDANELYSTLDAKIKDPSNASRAEQPAWKNLLAMADPTVYKLRAATAERQLAALYVSDVVSIDQRMRMQESVTKSLTAAGVTIPTELAAGDLESKKKASADLASEKYKDADDVIANIKDGAAAPDVKTIARVEYILTLYGEAQLARATGDSGTADTKVQAAITERDADKDLQLPALPPEIAPAQAIIPVPAGPTDAPPAGDAPAAPAVTPPPQ